MHFADRSTPPPTPTGGGLCNGSLGDPVINITFGHGPNPGPALPFIVPGATTNLTYIASAGDPPFPPPNDGQYSISNSVPFNDTWFFRAKDHTGTYPDGYMAIYNASQLPGEFYKQTVSGLCGSTTYEFAAWLANILNPYLRTEDLHPDVTFSIELSDGTVLQSYDTGPLLQTAYMTWKQYGLFFTTPSNVSSVVIRMINNNPGGQAHLGNDLAIDDITFRPCGPIITTSISNSQAVDSTAVCEGSSLHLYGTASTGYTNPSYFWQFSSDSGQTWIDLPNSNSFDLNVTPFSNGKMLDLKYRMVTAESANINSPNCRVASNAVTITVDPGPQGKLTGLDACFGDFGRMIFTAEVGIGPYLISYQDENNNYFTQNGLNSGDTLYVPFPIYDTTSFILEGIQDAIGCQNLTVANNLSTINLKPLPQGAISDYTGCAGDTARVNFLASYGSPPFTIKLTDGTSIFTINNVPYGGLIAIPNVINTTNTTYQLLSISDSNNLGCTRTDFFDGSTALVTVQPSPDVAFAAMNPVCGNVAPFIITGGTENSGLDGQGYYIGTGVSASGAFDPSKVDPGTYSIQYLYISDNGCVDSANQPLIVNPYPVPNTGSDIIACVNSQVQLHASGGNVYLWSPSTGLSDPTVADPIATGSGTITYSVAVTNVEGCSASDSVTLVISPLGKAAYTVPNAFTPNGDGKNDCFGVGRWGGIELEEFSIYNRWGQLVFHTRNPSDCWNGTFNGKQQDAGGYIYVIRAITPCGNISLKGTVVLIR